MKRVSDDIKKDIVDQFYWDARVIASALNRHAFIDGESVEVSVSDGVAEPSGRLDSRTAANTAVDIAERTRGVRDVVDEKLKGAH